MCARVRAHMCVHVYVSTCVCSWIACSSQFSPSYRMDPGDQPQVLRIVTKNLKVFGLVVVVFLVSVFEYGYACIHADVCACM